MFLTLKIYSNNRFESNTWGNGKVNAIGSVMRAVQLVTNVNTISNTGIACSVFPNPNVGNFSIDYQATGSGNLHLECFDLTGKLITRAEWKTTEGYNSNVFNWTDISNGAYYLHISGKEGRAIIKMIISH